MSFLRGILSAIAMLVVAGSPLYAAPAFAAQEPVVAQAAPSPVASTVTGNVTDAQNAPLAGATVTMNGPEHYTTTTDSNGRFSIPAVKPGVYAVTIIKPGYETLSEQLFAVVAGTPATINASLAQATFSSLRVIGRTTSRSTARGTFNTGPASIDTVSSQVFIDQQQQQVGRILDQQPGVITDRPATSVNNAAPGSINFPSVRGAFGNETANLVDGHALANGAFGDYVSSFINANMLQSIEIVKGPGAAAPQVVNGIGGTVNYRTKDPTPYLTGALTLGTDSFGGSFSNFRYSNTVANGKLAFIVDVATNGTVGPLNKTSNYFTFNNFNDQGFCVGGTWTPAGGCTGVASNTFSPQAAPTLPGVQRSPFTTNYLVVCCIPVTTQYFNRSELYKVRYNFSNTTSFTASYLGSQTSTDQNGNHIYQLPGTFDPTAGGKVAPGTYTGSVAPGPITIFDNVYYAPPYEINNEPMFQGELRTSFRKDNIVVRYFGASINRLQYGGSNDPNGPYTSGPFQLYGSFQGADGKYHTYNGESLPVTFFPYQQYCVNKTPGAAPAPCGSAAASVTTIPQYRDSPETRAMEEDKIQGGSFEIDHPLGSGGNIISFAFDANGQKSHAYNFVGQLYAPSIPEGTSQKQQTYLLRGIFNIGEKWSATWSNYLTAFQTHFTTDVGATFQDAAYSRFDSRVGLTYRATPNASFRLAAGSSFSPPYAFILDVTASQPQYSSTNLYFTNTLPSGAIKPESAFGYDLGTDIRMRDGIGLLSVDAYLTNLFGQFAQTNYVSNPAYAGVDTKGNPVTAPLYSTQFLNLGQSRYYGIEAAYKHDPAVGFGYVAQGSLTRAYPVSIPRSLYCGNLACTTIAPSAIIVGPNFQNGGASGSGASFSTLQNHAIPYSNGYAEIHYRWARDGFVSFGQQYIGPNNSSNLPAYFIANAQLRLPIIDDKTNIQISVDNLWNLYPNGFDTEAAGVPVILNNGKIGLTNQNTIGPRNFRFSLTRYIGRH